MRLRDLTESLTPELYHSTRLYNAAKVLEQGYFKLAASVGTDSELMHQKSGRFYYLSTSHSKVGDYTVNNHYIDGVVFNLHAEWLSHRYKVKPVDYWERMWLARAGRTSEAEERVFSKEPFIPLPRSASQLINSIHVLYQGNRVSPDDNRPYWLRKLLTNAKLRGIPIFVYDTPSAWLTQNPRKTTDIKSLIGLPEPQMPKPWPRMPRDYFKAWRELYHKNDYDSLSKDARRIVDRLHRDYNGDTTRSLASDIHNEKSSGNPALTKLLDIFRKLKINSAKEYVQHLKDKWPYQ